MTITTDKNVQWVGTYYSKPTDYFHVHPDLAYKPNLDSYKAFLKKPESTSFWTDHAVLKFRETLAKWKRRQDPVADRSADWG